MNETIIQGNEFLFPSVAVAEPIAIPAFASDFIQPSLGRYWRTIRHLRLSQLAYLGLHRVLRRADIQRGSTAQVALKKLPTKQGVAEWQPALAREILQVNNVSFVRPAQVGTWSQTEASRRQIFHANYCDFLNVDLTSPNDSDLLRSATRIAAGWLDQNPLGTEVGWQPFSLSLRIVNMLKFLWRNAERSVALGDAELVGRALDSLRKQTLVLESRLEKELLANHLLKNAKALLFAGTLLETRESRRWRAEGLKLLVQQIREQILPDGGHIERSPMYHAWVLDDLLDLRHLAAAGGDDLRPHESAISQCIDRMGHYLSEIVHPDGEIPLFSDSQLDVTRPTRTLLAEAGQAESELRSHADLSIFPASGYGVIRARESRSHLVFDCGPLGPNYQPGHNHADILSYELTLGGQRFVVDTGVSSYEPGEERQYERSTAAHNTVRVDRKDQAELWGSFRIGHRPKVGALTGDHLIDGLYLTGEHFGYRRIGVTHRRTIIRKGEAWIVVDMLSGRGEHLVESFVHLHPSVQVFPRGAEEDCQANTMAAEYALECGAARYCFLRCGPGEVKTAEAWYAPGFAIRLPQTVIHWTVKAKMPLFLMHAIVPEGSDPILVPEPQQGDAINVNGLIAGLRYRALRA